ncbi:MAG: hypothetical protein U5K71_04020 [Gracilimonas sp.]|nr:hypothetical protein [Gracilimonas sp.]
MEASRTGVSILGFQAKEVYEILGNIKFLIELWKKDSFEEYESPLRELLNTARFRLRFQVIGIVVWIFLSIIFWIVQI